jgi:RNA polymerase sigma-70 factor, ECF subfamily
MNPAFLQQESKVPLCSTGARRTLAETGLKNRVSVRRQPDNDAALMGNVMDGDETALATLYDRYSSILFGMLMRILRDSQMAEEVLQELFLQLWRKPGQFEAKRGSLPALLTVDGRDRAISKLRGRPRREMLAYTDGFFANALISSHEIESEDSRMQLLDTIKLAMARLPEEQRQAMELAYFEGMTQTEIAARTGSPLGTVKTRVRTGMQSLKQLLN